MSNMPPNPYYAFVELTIGEFNMTLLPPEHLAQFTYTRKPLNASNKFIISLFDETAMLVEYQLLKGYKEVKFRYGYVRGVTSPVYSGMVTEYDVDFTPAGALLNIEGLSSSISSFSNPATKTYKGMKIHEIVKAIAKEEKWIEGKIVPCQSVSDGDNKDKTFTRNNQAAQVFITNELIPYAKSAKSGDSNYVLSFEDTADGTKVNFYPIIQAGNNTKEATTNYEFQWGSGDRNSRVISFNPDYSGTLSLMAGGGTVEADTVSKIANEMFSVKYDNNTDSDRTTLAKKSTYDYKAAKRKIGGSSYSMEEMQNIAAYMWASHATFPVTAELVVLGDPTLNAFDMVSVVMLNKDGLPHHSSGVYLIKEIEDDIAGGSFQSKMSLFRNAMEIGVDESGGINVTMSSTYPASTTTGGTGTDASSSTSAIAGTSTSQIVNVAMAQKGNKGGQKFWSWWGYSYRVAWCAIFVSWCAEQAGIPKSVIPKYQGCTDGISQFKSLGRWKDASYTPQAGDIIFFDSPSNSGHTGIVVRCDGTTVYTIEGNTSDQVAERTYNKANPSRAIAGYGYTGQL